MQIKLIVVVDHAGIFWIIVDSGYVHNMTKSSDCLIKFQLFSKALLSVKTEII